MNSGDAAAVEDPQYLGAREAFRSAGARLDAVAENAEGMTAPPRPARLAYVTPTHQFPTGAVMSLSRRLGLLPGETSTSLDRVIEQAHARNVGVYPISPYYLHQTDALAKLLFGFGTLAPEQIERGVSLLCQGLNTLQTGRA